MTLHPELLDEPEPSLSAQDEYDEREQRRSERREELLAEAMVGNSSFWNLDEHDFEQHHAIFAALPRILAMPATGAQRWKALMAVVGGLAGEYATAQANEDIT